MSFVISVIFSFFYGWKLTLVILSCAPLIIISTAGKKQTFPNATWLVRCINKEWRKITAEKCEAMINKISQRLLKVIQSEGDQIYEH